MRIVLRRWELDGGLRSKTTDACLHGEDRNAGASISDVFFTSFKALKSEVSPDLVKLQYKKLFSKGNLTSLMNTPRSANFHYPFERFLLTIFSQVVQNRISMAFTVTNRLETIIMEFSGNIGWAITR